MIFFQQSASADKGMTPRDVKHGRYDTAVGAVLAAVFGIGALIAGAALLTHGGAGIQGFAGAGFPGALTHVAGGAAGTVFALGLVEAGAVAILTISASTAYAAGECVGVSHSFNSSPRSAAVFYAANVGVALLAAVVILIPGAPLLSIALNANVLATVLLPVSLVFMVMLANDTGADGPVGEQALDQRASGSPSSRSSGLCGAAYGVDSFLQTDPPGRLMSDGGHLMTRKRRGSIDHSPAIAERDLQRQERFEDELIMHLERDQFVAETSRPVPRAALGARASGRPVGAAGVRRARQPDGHLHLLRPAALTNRPDLTDHNGLGAPSLRGRKRRAGQPA